MKRKIISILMIAVMAALLIPAFPKKTEAAGTFNVTSYGAKGNDTADDTLAFQEALDAAAQAGGGTVRVPAGRYYIGSPSGMGSRPIRIYSNTTLEMDGAILISNAKDHYILQSWECSNVSIIGGIFDGNVSDTTIAQGLAGFGKMKNLTITGVTFRNFCATHGVVIDGVDTLKISNCNFEGYKVFTGSASSYEEQTQSTSFWSGEALHIDYLYNNADGKFNVKNVEVWDCTFDHVLSGVGTHHVYDDLIAENIKIHDNTFLNCYYDCCNASGFKNFEFYDNYAVNTPILVNSMNIKGKIYGNYLDNSAFSPSASALKNVYTFGRNYLELSGLSAIQLTNIHDSDGVTSWTNSTDVEVYDNDIYVKAYAYDERGESKICGIWATYDSIVNAHDNCICNAPYRGIYINTGSAIISDNILSDCFDTIYMNEDTGSVLQSNKVFNSKQRGITFNKSESATARDNLVYKTNDAVMGRGIVFQECTGQNMITGNTVMFTQFSGIYAYGTTLSAVENNTVCFSENRAISVSGDNENNIVINDSAAAVHNFVKVNEQAAGCEKCGFIEYLSADTQTGYKDYSVPTGHSWNDGETVREATVNQAGLIRYTCANDSSHVWEMSVTYQQDPSAPQTPDSEDTPASFGFSDVQPGMVAGAAYKAIYWAVDNGIAKGYSGGTFGPEDVCTREQFSIMLWRFAGEPASDTGTVNRFADVGSFSNNTSKKAVAWAVEQGIVAGFSDGSFKPGDKITRAQVAVMLWRFAGKPGSSSSSSRFSDISAYSSNVQNSIIWAENAGIAVGYSDGTFKPDGGCQRQHMAIFLNRFNSKVRSYKPE